ncbi:MAG: phosphoglycerate dehydrogenase [Thermodesulfovibrionales bacterium]
MKVLVSDNLSPRGIEILKKAGLHVDVKTGMSPDELRSVIGQYDGIVIRSATRMTADIIAAAGSLKVIGRAGSGLDNVDKAAASKKGIVVMNTPGGNTITTAEHTIALMFALARLVPQATASMKQGKWEKKKFMGVELFNKTLGIVGIGNIGGQVARKAQGLEMNVIAYDPFLSEKKAAEMGIGKVELEELFRRSDFITVHTPLTADTKNLIRAETIGLMKPTARIINCARGGIVNEKDLYQALKSGRIAGAALDVFEEEPPKDFSLLELDNVICTPHLGAATGEAQENVATAVAEQIVDYLVHGTIRNAVNFPSIAADQLPRLNPYLALAEKLGSFASQIIEGGVTEVTVEYRGEAAELDTTAVTIAAVKGLLTPILEETVNFVNAPFIARERGIEVKETRSPDAGDYHTMLSIQVKTSQAPRQIAGTLYGRRYPRIVGVDGFSVEIVPEGTMLFMFNNDKPGVIGNIGSFLGNLGINIARMHFGRETAGGRAISVVNIDTPVTDGQLAEIRKLPNIISARQVFL